MADKAASPFTGIHLTSQTSVAPSGTDQKLFAPSPRPAPPAAQRPAPSSRPAQPRTNESLEPRNQGGVETKLDSGDGPAPLFDINEPAYQNNTYAFTEEELWAIEDTKQELERKHAIKVTKYNLIRLGVHLLIEDYRRNRAASVAVTRLRTKSQ